MTQRTSPPERSRPSPPPNPPARSKAPPPERPRGRFSLGLLVFAGSLMGSLLGVAADFGDATETFERVQRSLQPQLCVVGSNTILGEGITMAQDWETVFEETASANVSIRGIGSVRGVQEAAGGQCVHVLAMSEPMTPDQYTLLTNAGVEIECAAEIGYDVIAFVTDINSRPPTILDRLLPSILTGSITNWADIGGQRQAIIILARPGSGTTDYVLINAGGYRDPNPNDDQYFPPGTNYVACDSNEDCLNQVLATPGALYWVSTAWMKTQPQEYLQVIPVLEDDEAFVNPLDPDVDFRIDNYPNSLIRPLYLYVLDTPTADEVLVAQARQFLNFVRSVRGQQILEQYQFYTFFDSPADVQIDLPPGFEPGPDGRRPVCRAA